MKMWSKGWPGAYDRDGDIAVKGRTHPAGKVPVGGQDNGSALIPGTQACLYESLYLA